MKTIVIAFDIDGTLRCNCKATCEDVNARVVELAHLLNRMKNTELIAWSGGGKDYAWDWIDMMGLNDVFKKSRCYSKLDAPKVDIAIDDQHEFSLGKINLIVREKK